MKYLSYLIYYSVLFVSVSGDLRMQYEYFIDKKKDLGMTYFLRAFILETQQQALFSDHPMTSTAEALFRCPGPDVGPH